MKRIKKDSIFLIDGSSLLYRSYYGLRPLHTSDGTPTQAVYGFCRAIKKLIDDFDPQYLLILWDSKGKTFRSEIFADYKATRQEAPSDLFLQKEYILKFIEAVQIAQVAKTGYEADDLIYSLVKDYEKKPCIIVGPDKDLHQLISPQVLILDPIKKEIIDEETFEAKRGFEPEKLPFYHALVGDPSDNIPGVKGIGKKGATELVKQFDSLHDLYKNIDSIEKNRLRSTLETYKDDAYLSLKLFTLKHVKVPITLNKIKFDKTHWSGANELFEELEFKSLITEPTKQKAPEAQMSFLVKEKAVSPKKHKPAPWKCIIIKNKDDIKKLIETIKEKKLFALDTETTGLKPLQDKLVGLSIAYDTKKAYYVPLAHTQNQQLDRDEVLTMLKPVFTSKSIKKILQNAKFDRLALWHYGYELDGIEFDTLLMANLLREEWAKIGLKKLSMKYLGEKMDTFGDVIGKKYKTFDEVPIPEAAMYSAHDSLQTFKLMKILRKLLNKEKKLAKLYTNVELPLSQVLFDMERTGIMLDEKILEALNKKVTRRLATIQKKIIGALKHKKIKSPEDINLNSPKQIEALLFDELKLPVIKKSLKGKRSTDQEVLTELAKQHPVPGLILQYRELFKLKSTYIEALPLAINPETKRIHTSFSQTMVATGRLSSSDPNLQNIPAGGDFGSKIREAFIAPHGSQFISADYSQIELRVLAHLTGDKTLHDSFFDSQDIHARTASEIFDIPLNKITHEQRQIGKRINFSIMYGVTPFGLAKDLGIKQSEAKEYITKYFERYPKVAEWMEKTVAQATKDGFVETWLGRRRYVSGLREKNQALYQAARRIAINSPVQGTSAEIIKLAMINLDEKLKKGRFLSKIILQIHDELLLECPTAEVDRVKKMVQKAMELVVKWSVPLIVSIRTGKNWAKITK